MKTLICFLSFSYFVLLISAQEDFWKSQQSAWQDFGTKSQEIFSRQLGQFKDAIEVFNHPAVPNPQTQPLFHPQPLAAYQAKLASGAQQQASFAQSQVQYQAEAAARARAAAQQQAAAQAQLAQFQAQQESRFRAQSAAQQQAVAQAQIVQAQALAQIQGESADHAQQYETSQAESLARQQAASQAQLQAIQNQAYPEGDAIGPEPSQSPILVPNTPDALAFVQGPGLAQQQLITPQHFQNTAGDEALIAAQRAAQATFESAGPEGKAALARFRQEYEQGFGNAAQALAGVLGYQSKAGINSLGVVPQSSGSNGLDITANHVQRGFRSPFSGFPFYRHAQYKPASSQPKAQPVPFPQAVPFPKGVPASYSGAQVPHQAHFQQGPRFPQQLFYRHRQPIPFPQQPQPVWFPQTAQFSQRVQLPQRVQYPPPQPAPIQQTVPELPQRSEQVSVDSQYLSQVEETNIIEESHVDYKTECDGIQQEQTPESWRPCAEQETCGYTDPCGKRIRYCHCGMQVSGMTCGPGHPFGNGGERCYRSSQDVLAEQKAGIFAEVFEEVPPVVVLPTEHAVPHYDSNQVPVFTNEHLENLDQLQPEPEPELQPHAPLVLHEFPVKDANAALELGGTWENANQWHAGPEQPVQASGYSTVIRKFSGRSN